MLRRHRVTDIFRPPRIIYRLRVLSTMPSARLLRATPCVCHAPCDFCPAFLIFARPSIFTFHSALCLSFMSAFSFVCCLSTPIRLSSVHSVCSFFFACSRSRSVPSSEFPMSSSVYRPPVRDQRLPVVFIVFVCLPFSLVCLFCFRLPVAWFAARLVRFVFAPTACLFHLRVRLLCLLPHAFFLPSVLPVPLSLS